LVREGNTRGLFKGREVVSLLTGEPEYLDPLKGEAPVGWIVTGYPWYGIQTTEHQAFLKAYQSASTTIPRLGSVVGYTAIQSLAAGLRKAGGADTEKLIAAFKGLEVTSPFGPIRYRPEDHQSTMGAFVGRTRLQNGVGAMVGLPLPRRCALSAAGRGGAEIARSRLTLAPPRCRIAR
jgi:branched-chain amino acid transport system substrate-binding protein